MMSKIKSILCPCALGPRWEEVFDYAMSLAAQYDAKVTVLHAVEPLSPTTKAIMESGMLEKVRREAIKKIERDLNERVQRFVEQAKAADPKAGERLAGVHVEEAFAGRHVLERAKSIGADLIVMGTHDHSMMGELLGSVAHRVVHGSPIPVLLVPLRGS